MMPPKTVSVYQGKNEASPCSGAVIGNTFSTKGTSRPPGVRRRADRVRLWWSVCCRIKAAEERHERLVQT